MTPARGRTRPGDGLAIVFPPEPLRHYFASRGQPRGSESNDHPCAGKRRGPRPIAASMGARALHGFLQVDAGAGGVRDGAGRRVAQPECVGRRPWTRVRPVAAAPRPHGGARSVCPAVGSVHLVKYRSQATWQLRLVELSGEHCPLLDFRGTGPGCARADACSRAGAQGELGSGGRGPARGLHVPRRNPPPAPRVRGATLGGGPVRGAARAAGSGQIRAPPSFHAAHRVLRRRHPPRTRPRSSSGPQTFRRTRRWR